ncbi:hypothetical protein FOL47_008618 [Perkinsus chesapeaki]|uniref:Uncharacterized protein n=1 Tax=Perkinsus chesapeaki TaxID=330153 RepID=A0A7J6LCV2_PERCH|nr:hypothetical protein FOL47_008618 [Perkinsus chesapeaki]
MCSYVVVTPQWVVDAAKFGKLPDVHLYPPVGLEEKYAQEMKKKETRARQQERLGQFFARHGKRPREGASPNSPAHEKVEVERQSKRGVGMRSLEEIVLRANSAEGMMSSIEARFGDSVRVAGVRGRLEKYPRSKHDLEVEIVEVDNLESFRSFQEIVLELFGQGASACTVYVRPSERGHLLRLVAPEVIDDKVSDGLPGKQVDESDIAKEILEFVTGGNPPESCWRITKFLRGLDQAKVYEAMSRAITFLLGSRRLDRAQALMRGAREALGKTDSEKLESFYTLAVKLSNGGIGPRLLR